MRHVTALFGGPGRVSGLDATGACPPWCAYPHGCADLDDDRRHIGATFDIPLSTEPPETDLRVGPNGLEEFATDDAQTINARLDQHVSAPESLVRLFSGAGTRPNYAVGLTLAEAEEFAHGILDLVEEARSR